MLFQRKRFPKKLKGKTSVAPSSPEECLEQGSIDEESGDRWLSSDLSKALRFYQKAYETYLQTLTLPGCSKEVFVDATYNSCRLVFHVHSHYIKLEGVEVSNLVGVEEVIGSSNSVLISDIEEIAVMHQDGIHRITEIGGVVPLDFLYNTVVVFTEEVELLDDEDQKIFDILSGTRCIFGDLLERQYAEIETLESQLNEEVDPQTQDQAQDSNQDGNQSQEEVTTETVVQPPDVYDTLITGLEFIQTVVEKQVDIDAELLYEQLAVFEEKLKRFSEENAPLMLAPVTHEQIQRWNILLLDIRSINKDPLQYWKEALNDPSLNFDSYEVIIQSIELYLGFHDVSPEQEWDLLTFTNELFKRQQVLATKQLADEAKGDGLGSALVQMSGLMLSRGDLEMERRQIQHKQDVHALLRNNALAYYKNALSYAQRSGGLREKIIDKLQRQRKAKEATVKLKILDGTATEAELAAVFGDDWRDELEMFQ